MPSYFFEAKLRGRDDDDDDGDESSSRRHIILCCLLLRMNGPAGQAGRQVDDEGLVWCACGRGLVRYQSTGLSKRDSESATSHEISPDRKQRKRKRERYIPEMGCEN
jgi:hypothetical protein